MPVHIVLFSGYYFYVSGLLYDAAHLHADQVVEILLGCYVEHPLGNDSVEHYALDVAVGLLKDVRKVSDSYFLDDVLVGIQQLGAERAGQVLHYFRELSGFFWLGFLDFGLLRRLLLLLLRLLLRLLPLLRLSGRSWRSSMRR